MQMLLIIQNDPIVPAGALMVVCKAEGVSYHLVEAFSGDLLPPLHGIGGVVVLGGTMSVCDIQRFSFLTQVAHFVESVLREEIPYLGICLGGQLLAEVLGGKVRRLSNGECGLLDVSTTAEGTRDRLFDGLPERFLTFQWHEDSFEPPSGTTWLARSEFCRFQAFRWKRAAYGVQFHPEVTSEIVSMWADGSGERAREVRLEFEKREEEYRPHSLRLLSNFLALLQSGTEAVFELPDDLIHGNR
jgi:GMP synthase (glutamine-hydrolysing)